MWPFKRKNKEDLLQESKNRINEMYKQVINLGECGFSDDIEILKDKIKYLTPSTSSSLKKEDSRLIDAAKDFAAIMGSKHSKSIDKQKAIIILGNKINRRNQAL